MESGELLWAEVRFESKTVQPSFRNLVQKVLAILGVSKRLHDIVLSNQAARKLGGELVLRDSETILSSRLGELFFVFYFLVMPRPSSNTLVHFLGEQAFNPSCRNRRVSSSSN